MNSPTSPQRPSVTHARVPLLLGAVLATIMVITLFTSPAGKLNWALEVGPAVAAVVALAVTYRRFPMTHLVYVLVFLHALVLVYGGYSTYAKAPLGEWAREVFGFQRNNYDKVGHFAFGFFPVMVLREVLLRAAKMSKGGWFTFVLIGVVLGFAAAYELIEWWAALLLDPSAGDAFLGTQGDPFDAQSDMFFAGVGAVAALVALSRVHDRAMSRLLPAVKGPR